MASDEIYFQLVSQYRPISLADMEGLFLMNRADLKFVLPIRKLDLLLRQLSEHYQVLQINGERIFRYTTNYFDTPDLKLYRDHQNGKLNRFKIRTRTYEINNLSYFEIKKKTNKGKTVKSRIKIQDPDKILEEQKNFVCQELPGFNQDIELKAQNRFKRITLASFNSRERITIDYELSISQNGREITFPHIAVVEIKKEHSAKQSQIITALRDMRIQSHSFSKYCFGIALLNKDLKQNTFKPSLLYLNKLAHVDHIS